MGEATVVDKDEALVVEQPSTMMMKDNISSQIQIEDTLTMTILRGTTNLKFNVFTVINLTTFNMCRKKLAYEKIHAN